jgi:hypothetical protein
MRVITLLLPEKYERKKHVATTFYTFLDFCPFGSVEPSRLW